MSPWKTSIRARRKSDGCCFNGATAMSPWKTAALLTVTRSIVVLQWDHGDVAVEDDEVDLQVMRPRRASMGPRRCRRGRPGAGGASSRARRRFNGATAM